MGFLYWRWAAIGLLMGMLGLMIALGLGRRRGTRLHSIRIGLWVMVVTLGGAGVATTGCTPSGSESDTDAAEDSHTCYLPADPGSDAPDIPDDTKDVADVYDDEATCYLPMDPGPDAPDTMQDPAGDETMGADQDGTEVEDGDTFDMEAADEDAAGHDAVGDDGEESDVTGDAGDDTGEGTP